ncbi:CpaF family protein [Galactobacter caseinivorans]|uniref:CpaF family protein n=1 Tax=Galactobacter caseinivorans TaxID=2676123 RepID=A0A496PKG9_9MICC|nr:ATPase, T2SS/T4P/T4SS family [Galactobacter caseinivorans]RKW70996.1 CpaF family protein [Galactobacter caseinivorans]
MSDAVKWVEGEVRAAVIRDGLHPGRDHERIHALVTGAVQDYDLRSLSEDLPRLGDLETAGRAVMDALTGLGPLQPFMDDPGVEEIWLNGAERVFIARGGVSELTSLRLSHDEVRTLVERMLAPTNRRLDLSSPFVDAALADGSRLHVAIPDVTRGEWFVNIRKFVARAQRLDHLVDSGSLSVPAARYLQAAVTAGLNILVSGATQAGKTTLLNCLTAAIGARERLVTAEEVFELTPPLRDVAALQCRPANLDGAGEIGLRRLVKEALRMRPDRIVVGEVREAESLDLLLALNAGLPGMCTIHANGAREALSKMCTLPLLAGNNIGADFVVPTVAASLDLVVHCVKAGDGRRSVREIALVGSANEGGTIELSRIFVDEGAGLRLRGEADPEHPKFRRAGIEIRPLLGSAA